MTGRRMRLAAPVLAACAAWGLVAGCGGGGGGGFVPPAPAITVTSPDGGETWYSEGPDRDITWTNASFSGNVDVHYTVDTAGDPAGWAWVPVAAAQDIPNAGSFAWAIPGENSSACRVRVREAGGAGIVDESNADFTISPPAIAVVSPNGAEVWGAGSTQTVTWAGGGFASVRVELTRDGTWAAPETIAGPIDVGVGSFSWPVTGPGSSACLVRVSDWADGVPADDSAAAFTIAEIALSDPTGGEVWDVDSSQSITWTSSGVANVKIELSRDGNWTDGDGSDVDVLAASVSAAAGAFPWTPGHPVSASCLVRVSDAGTSGAVDLSGATFTVAGIEVVSPNGGETVIDGQDYEITWLSPGVTGNVDIRYTADTTGAPATWVWTDVALGILNTGSHTWPVPIGDNANCRVRVDLSAGGVGDESDADFRIGLPPMAGPFDYGPEVVTRYTWDGSDFVEDTRRTFGYGLAGKVGTILEETWAGGTGPWESSARTTYTYNANSTVNTITVESWNGASWDVDTVTTCNYSGGFMASKDIDDLAAGTVSQIIYTYTGGLLTREQTEAFDGVSTWTPTDALTYGYDAGDRLSSGTLEIEDILSGGLTQIGTLSQTYNAGDRLDLQTIDISYMFIVATAEVGPAAYDATGRLQTTEIAMTATGQSPVQSMLECFYDVNGRLEEVLLYDWSDVASDWALTGKRAYTNTDAGSSFTFQYESPTAFPYSAAEPTLPWPSEMYGCGDVNPHLW